MFFNFNGNALARPELKSSKSQKALQQVKILPSVLQLSYQSPSVYFPWLIISFHELKFMEKPQTRKFFFQDPVLDNIAKDFTMISIWTLTA